MKYIHLFKTKTEHDAIYFGDKYKEPWFAYTMDAEVVTYNKPHDYSLDYLTTIAREDGTISFNIWQSMGTDYITSISYSTDNGDTWNTTSNQDNKQQNIAIDVNVVAGDRVLWKGTASQTGYHDGNAAVGSFFSSDCEFDAEGNVMSLLYGDDFVGKYTVENDGGLCRLFSDYDGNLQCGIVDASNLSLPATTLAIGCYNIMFLGCTSLTTAPALPATTLASFCYSGMFGGCTSLTTAPDLPATTLADYCYDHMFYGCTSLTTAPATLPATTLAEWCYGNMFESCTSLTTAPALPATTLASNCYEGMFKDCTSLTSAPTLSAMTLADDCYSGMFYNCTALTTAPALPATTLAGGCYIGMFGSCTALTSAPATLPATTLAQYCYQEMFYGCTALVTAPELPATTLAQYCYHEMFGGCSRLSYIKAMFTTTPSGTYTQNWVDGVASTGTFVKNSAATWNLSGSYGVPSGWTVETASA